MVMFMVMLMFILMLMLRRGCFVFSMRESRSGFPMPVRSLPHATMSLTRRLFRCRAFWSGVAMSTARARASAATLTPLLARLVATAVCCMSAAASSGSTSACSFRRSARPVALVNWGSRRAAGCLLWRVCCSWSLRWRSRLWCQCWRRSWLLVGVDARVLERVQVVTRVETRTPRAQEARTECAVP